MCYNNSMNTEKSFIICVKEFNFWCARPHNSSENNLYVYKDGEFK